MIIVKYVLYEKLGEWEVIMCLIKCVACVSKITTVKVIDKSCMCYYSS